MSDAFATSDASELKFDDRASATEYLSWLSDTAAPSDAASLFMNTLSGGNDGMTDVLTPSEWIALTDGVSTATGVFDDIASALTDN